jgi:hypothetical protein
MRILVFVILALIMLVPCYIAGGAVQLSIAHFYTPADVPRMAYERMPYILLLSPIAPALAFDMLLQGVTAARIAWFSCFLLPFLALYGLCMYWLVRSFFSTAPRQP